MFLSLLALMIFGQADARHVTWWDPIDRGQFEAWRVDVDPEVLARETASASETYLMVALDRRGHSGDRSHLEGCDLFDIAADRHRRIVRAAREAPTYEAFLAVQAAVRADVRPEGDGSTMAGVQEETMRRFENDQALRSKILEPGTAPGTASTIFEERMSVLCETDLDNGAWLQRAEVARALMTSDDPAFVRAVSIMGIHADHLPWLQDRFAQILFARSLDPTARHGAMRLKDSALVNVGRAQMFGTGVICQDGHPAFAGAADLDDINPLRATMNLPPIDLEAMTRAGFCG